MKKEEENISRFKKLDVTRLNNVLGTGSKILKVLYIILILLLVYLGIILLKEFKVFSIILTVISVISPLFIGFIIAWLLNPLVNKLTKKGLNRAVSVILIYALLIILLYLFTLIAVPALANQIKDIVGTIPTILSDLKQWVEGIFDKLSDISLENLDTTKAHFFDSIEKIGSDLQTNLPQTALNIISSLVSGVGKILLSFIVGFYILFNFNEVSNGFVKFLPKKWRKDAEMLLSQISTTTYDYVKGTLVISLILMIVSLIGFAIIGLKAPLLIAMFCAITNLIPYIGPYMGAAVAGLVGFSQSNVIGILTLVFILVVQTLEGNFLTPLFMSKKMNLHPVTILISLLIFGYFFGIIGMVIATPLIAFLKILFNFFDQKYKFFEYTKD
jgi:predicted PurR-regulated permease PerM